MSAYIHLASVATLMLGPPYVYLHASTLAEADSRTSITNGIASYVASAVLKLILLAVLCPTEQSLYRDVMYFLVAACDVPVMWWCLHKLNHRTVSLSDKFQAVGLGWMVADTICRRVWPAGLQALGEDFTWATVLSGIQANVALAHFCALAALVTLVFNRKVRAPGLGAAVAVMAVFCAMLPQLPQVFEQRGLLQPAVAVGVDALSTTAMCVVAYICHHAHHSAV